MARRTGLPGGLCGRCGRARARRLLRAPVGLEHRQATGRRCSPEAGEDGRHRHRRRDRDRPASRRALEARSLDACRLRPALSRRVQPGGTVPLAARLSLRARDDEHPPRRRCDRPLTRRLERNLQPRRTHAGARADRARDCARRQARVGLRAGTSTCRRRRSKHRGGNRGEGRRSVFATPGAGPSARAAPWA